MRYPGFLGPSAALQSPYASAERCINWYVEPAMSGGAPTEGTLLPTPGFETWATASDTGVRGAIDIVTQAFMVIGTSFVELFEDGTTTVKGTVSFDTRLATISWNGTAGGQLFITTGGNGYCYDLDAETLTLVVTGEATMGGMLDGRFLAFNEFNGRVRISEINDGLTWDSSVVMSFGRSIAPDPAVSMKVAGSLIWMIGSKTAEAWYNAGNFPQPFAPALSSLVQYGTRAPFSVGYAGSSLMWLAHDQNGSAMIVRTQGYTAQPVTDYALSTALSMFDREGTLDDCECLTYEQEGHTFVNFNFYSAHSTWTVDIETGLWHERGKWRGNLNRYDAWAPRVHVHAFGKHLVGSRDSAVISSMDVSLGQEADGSAIRRLRIPPPLWADTTGRITVDRFDLLMETGLGLLSGQGSDPLVMFRASKDARTFGNQRLASAGATGKYLTRVFWTRCGSSPKVWMPEITVSDPVPWRISGAEIQASGVLRSAKAA